MRLPSYYRRGFDTFLARFYDFIFAVEAFGMAKQLRYIILSKIPRKSRKLLDMATGSGAVAIEIKKKLPQAEAIGIDLSKAMLSIAKKKAIKEGLNVKFLKRNIEHTGFRKDYFDGITVSFGLHEIPRKNRLNVMKEAYRITKKGGRFIIMDFSSPIGKIRQAMLAAHFGILEPSYAKTILKQDLAGELKEIKFHDVVKNNYFSGLIQTIEGVR